LDGARACLGPVTGDGLLDEARSTGAGHTAGHPGAAAGPDGCRDRLRTAVALVLTTMMLTVSRLRGQPQEQHGSSDPLALHRWNPPVIPSVGGDDAATSSRAGRYDLASQPRTSGVFV